MGPSPFVKRRASFPGTLGKELLPGGNKEGSCAGGCGWLGLGVEGHPERVRRIQG